MKNWIKQLIAGNFGLCKTFWLCFFTVGIFINVIIRLIEHAIDSIESLSLILLMFLVLAFSLAYLFIALTGVWNSAKRYTGRAIWKFLAKIVVIMNVIAFFISTMTAIILYV